MGLCTDAQTPVLGQEGCPNASHNICQFVVEVPFDVVDLLTAGPAIPLICNSL